MSSYTSSYQPRPPPVGRSEGHSEAPRGSGMAPATGSKSRAMEIRNYTQSYGVLELIDELSGRILEERPTDVIDFSLKVLLDRLERGERASCLVDTAKYATACAERAGATAAELQSVPPQQKAKKGVRMEGGLGLKLDLKPSSPQKSIDVVNETVRQQNRNMQSSSSRGKNTLTEAHMAKEARIEALAANEFFIRFEPKLLSHLVDLTSAFTLASGGVVYKRGDSRQFLYVITDGLVRLTERRGDGFWDLGTFSKGHCLGESALARPEILNHRTEAMAVNNATFLMLDISRVREFFESRSLKRQLSEAAAAVSRNRMRAATHKEGGVRVERDVLGDREIPMAAYYGIRTQRAKDIFSASGVAISRFPSLVQALCMVKKASALANLELRLLDEEKANAICQACDEGIEGNMHDEFCIDMLQGGAGVSTMANANEVIANRATELLGGAKGVYTVHPYEHVNMSQSDDAYHTVLRLAIALAAPAMLNALRSTVRTMYAKAWEFKDVVKMGRTMLQDALPVTMGREYLAYAKQLEEDLENQAGHVLKIQECLLGGTTLGTGLGAVEGFGEVALRHLNEVSGYNFTTPPDLVKSMTDMNTVVSFSGGLRRIAVRLSKICNDLRLLASGPRCGLKEIDLPEQQPGSSIMPGKVNPVIPEAMNQICYSVIGNDTTVTMAAEGAQLNSCIFDSVILFSVLESMQILDRGCSTLNKKCLVGIKANEKRCREGVESSVSKLTAAVHVLGYEKCDEVANIALERRVKVEDVLREQGLLSEQQMKELFDVKRMAGSHTDIDIPEPSPEEEHDQFETNTPQMDGIGSGAMQIDEKKITRFCDRLDPDGHEKMSTLLHNQVFQVLLKMRPDEVQPLLDMMDRIDLDAGAALYRAGDERKAMFLLKQGVVRIQKKYAGDDVGNVVAALSDGSSIGETALLESSTLSRHQMNAIAEITSTCYSIDLDQLLPHLQMPENVRMAELVMDQVSVVLYNRLKGVQMDGGLKRPDTDLLGTREVDISVYWGVQTLRAVENFAITGTKVRQFPNLVKAFGAVKKACAIANRDLGLISVKQGDAIIRACDEIMQGKLADQFPTDMIQGGAGTSTNMNANEVIANRANEILGDKKGTYKFVHPNDHVNKSQSTNDAYPTSLRLSIVLSAPKLMEAMTKVAEALRAKGTQFDHVVKMGRTQLQDAVPMTLGQEFFSLSRSVEDDIELLRVAARNLQITNLGGTAIGTGLCADRDFPRVAAKRLTEVTGIPFALPKDLIQASSDTGGMLTFSNVLKRIAIRMSKICNDFRLLSSGPRAGFGEIELPCVQPQTSLIPGKNDPDIPEMISMCAYRVAGADTVCAMASHAAQLQLNVMEPVMIYRILDSIDMLSSAFSSLAGSCINKIKANEANCKELVNNSIGIVTALLPTIGYKNCSRAAAIANKTGMSLIDVLLQEKMMTQEQIARELVPEKMVTAAKLSRKSGDE